MEITRNRKLYAAILAAIMLVSTLFAGVAPALAADANTPTGLAVQTSDGKVALSWDAVTGAFGYMVYRSETVDGTYGSLAMTMQNSHEDTKAEAGKTYYYKVASFKINGISFAYSEPSEPVSNESGQQGGGEDSNDLAASHNLQNGAAAKFEDSKVNITWPQYKDYTSYIILRSEAVDPNEVAGYDAASAQLVNGLSYIQSGNEIQTGKTYWYLIKPMGSSGDVVEEGKIIAFSPVGVQIDSGSSSAVPAPGGLALDFYEDPDDHTKLVWMDWYREDVAYYEIYRAVDTSDASAFTLLNSTRTNYYDDDITGLGFEGKTVYYYVVAVSEQEERSNKSEIKGIKVPGDGTASPSPAASPTPSQAPAASPSPVVTPSPVVSPSPVATITPTPVPTPSPKPSPTVMPTPHMPSPDAPYPATKPVAKALTVDSVQISWTRSRDAQFYHIYRADDVYKTYTEVAYVDRKVTKWVDYDLPHDGIFYYYITAEKNGVESDKTSIVSAAVGYNIYNLEVAAYSERTYDGYNLSWDKFPAARKYYVYVSVDGVNYTYLAATSSNVYNHRRVNHTLPYWYKVVSNNGGEAVAYSASTRGTMEVIVNKTDDFDNMGLRISWSEIGQSSHYTILRSTDNVSFTEIGKVYGQRLTYLDVPLEQGTTYYYRVVASNGEMGTASGTTNKEFLMLWATATGTGEGNRGVQLKWNSITNATHYTIYRSHKGANNFVEIGRTAELGWLDKNGLLAFNQYDYKVVSSNGSERIITCGTLW